MEHAVLFVDDDQNVLDGLARALREQPYRILTARSGKEGMAVLKTRPIDVLVTDERMPGMSGGDLVAWVAEHYPDVTRIVFTGHATAASAMWAINEAEVYRYFTKPHDCVALALAIRKALERKDPPEEKGRKLESAERQEAGTPG